MITVKAPTICTVPIEKLCWKSKQNKTKQKGQQEEHKYNFDRFHRTSQTNAFPLFIARTLISLYEKESKVGVDASIAGVAFTRADTYLLLLRTRDCWAKFGGAMRRETPVFSWTTVEHSQDDNIDLVAAVLKKRSVLSQNLLQSCIGITEINFAAPFLGGSGSGQEIPCGCGALTEPKEGSEQL